jgi:hypothetical protein
VDVFVVHEAPAARPAPPTRVPAPERPGPRVVAERDRLRQTARTYKVANGGAAIDPDWNEF